MLDFPTSRPAGVRGWTEDASAAGIIITFMMKVSSVAFGKETCRRGRGCLPNWSGLGGGHARSRQSKAAEIGIDGSFSVDSGSGRGDARTRRFLTPDAARDRARGGGGIGDVS